MINNSPKNLNLSDCTVSIDEGKTSKTLSEWAKTANDTIGEVVGLSETSINVNEKCEILSKQIKDLNFDNYLSRDQSFTSGNVLLLDNTNQFIGPKARSDNGTVFMSYGHILNLNGFRASPDPACTRIIEHYTLKNKYWVVLKTWTDDKHAYRSFVGDAFHPDRDGVGDLGIGNHAWNNIYSKTALSVTSDKNEKKIVSALGNEDNVENQKLLDAIYNLDVHTFKLNYAIDKKGEGKARLHNGFIAQEVEKSLKDKGLSASDYGMWIEEKVFETQDIETGEKDDRGNPVTKRECVFLKDADGNQVYRQSLRYDEIFCVFIQAFKQKLKKLEDFKQIHEQRISDLETRLSNLK